MKQNQIQLVLSALIGFFLGIEWMTKFRFHALVGLGEIIYVMVVIYLLIKLLPELLSFERNPYGGLKLYFLTTVVLILPTVTLIFYFFSDLKGIGIYYLFIYAMNLLFTFLLIEGWKKEYINLKIVLFALIITFTSTYLISLGAKDIYESTLFGRFAGFATNPNKPMIYVISILLLSAMFARKYFAYFLIFSLFVSFFTGSDAGLISLIFGITVYLTLYTYNFLFKSLTTKIIILSALVLFFILYFDQIINSLIQFDQGSRRILLLANGLEALSVSPIFGYGVGSFSGIVKPFEGIEAHNTFIDLSLQFGLIFVLTILIIMFYASINLLKQKDFIVFSTFMSFLLYINFHFVARHPIFWVLISVLIMYLDNKNIFQK